MRGHTGGELTMGQGCPIVSLTKQKINTQSSTESEIVGVNDMMSSILIIIIIIIVITLPQGLSAFW
jgi:hypothetical protein